MRKLPFVVALAALAVFAQPAGGATDRGSHADAKKLPQGCASCHAGHGAGGTALLPEAEEAFCYSCHGRRDRLVGTQKKGKLAAGVFPSDLEAVFGKFSRHPVGDAGKHRAGEELKLNNNRHAECADCHDHHDADKYKRFGVSQRKRSPLQLYGFESELCYRCHGTLAGGRKDVAMQFSPSNRSFHPVEARSKGAGRGLLAPWTASDIMNCSDCHGNDDPRGPQGPHGSDFSPILVRRFEATDGAESGERYSLCYGCHSRDALFTNTGFPSHGLHVQKGGATCAACHNSHGSPFNRALIDFPRATVRPSKNGRLEFVSGSPGQGSCSLVCHGVEHDKKAY